ncbi:MAG: hypothetical protein MZV64_28420 [Ignavibacteriales bacterium]|nr:hypothetical protein [Ignavibacteriales bacterium]
MAWQQWVRLESPLQGVRGRGAVRRGAERDRDEGHREAAGRCRRGLRPARRGVWRCGGAGRPRRCKAGEYRFTGAMSAAEVVARIARGDVYLRAVTFREGLTIRQMAAIFEACRVRPGEGLHARRPATRACAGAFDPAAREPGRLPVPRHLRAAARRVGARTLSGAWWRASSR